MDAFKGQTKCKVFKTTSIDCEDVINKWLSDKHIVWMNTTYLGDHGSGMTIMVMYIEQK
jgi:hypothetical protein